MYLEVDLGTYNFTRGYVFAKIFLFNCVKGTARLNTEVTNNWYVVGHLYSGESSAELLKVSDSW